MALEYFYDAQIRRIILHFMRIFNGYQYRRNTDSGYTYETVPVIYGDGSAQTHFIINQGSENVAQAVPRMAASISDIELNMEQSRYAALKDDVLFTEKQFDEETGQYVNKAGKRYHVERLVPTPLNITMTLDVWTSNTDQKLQILEQLLLIFNPMLEIQKSTNILDWTALNRVTLTGINFDNVGVPKGADTEPNVMSLTFLVECYVSPPARVNRQTLINTIINNIWLDEKECCDDEPDARAIVTPGNHSIAVTNDVITLLGADASLHDEHGNVYSWPQLIDCYGTLQEGFSKIRLKWHHNLNDDSLDIIGTFEYDPVVDNIVYFHIDPETIPAATMTNFDMIINPHYMVPNKELPVLQTGQRYLITDDIGEDSETWGMLEAKKHDIIEYTGSEWIVAFDASTGSNDEIIINSTTGSYLRFVDGEWKPLFEGIYHAGYWRLQL